MAFDDPNLRNLVEEVSLKKVRVFNPGTDVNIIAFDCGMKANIIRCVRLGGRRRVIAVISLSHVPMPYGK